MSNLKQADNKERKPKHVVINTELSDATPDNQEARRSQTKTRPASLTLCKGDSKAAKFSRSRSKSIDYNAQKKTAKSEKNLSFEKLHKLKEKLLHSSPELSENVSDNESTPLVSEVSSPSPSEFAKSSSSASSSFPLSPLSQKSISPELKSNKNKSEQNLPNATEMNTIVTLYGNKVEFGKCRRSRTTSDSLSSYSISPLLTESNVSLNTISHSSSHLSRQDALDDENDVLTDVYCDPNAKN